MSRLERRRQAEQGRKDRFGYMVPQQPRYAPFPEEQQPAAPEPVYGAAPYVAPAASWPEEDVRAAPYGGDQGYDAQQGYQPPQGWGPQQAYQAPQAYAPQQVYDPQQGYPAGLASYLPYEEAPQPLAPAKPRRRRAPYVALLILCLGALGGMGYYLHQARQAYEPFLQQRAFLRKQVFFEGIKVDGIPLGGLSMQQALERVGQAGARQDGQLSLQVSVDGRPFHISGEALPFERNVQAVLESAWAIGRQGFRGTIGSVNTPFQVRYEHARFVQEKQVELFTYSTYDRERLRGLIAQIATQVDRDPTDAMIASFDFNTRAFTFTRDAPGAKMDQQALFLQISQQLDQGQLTQQHAVHSAPILPRITAVELQNSFAQLASFSTETTKDQKRNTNIQLAARAVTGSTVMPGESFSFNQVVGERNAQKGYQMAPAIAGGVTFDEIGGGVCQVSSTLFNAAALADMQIVKRSPHAWPSSYVEKGRDATVNWPNLDFEFRNPKSTPVFIVATYEGRRLTVEFYGMRAALGEGIRLETELVSTTEPPRDPIMQLNASLSPGSQKVLKKARTGYLVDTYRVYTRGGQVYHREKLFSSNYRMVQQVIEYN